MNQKWFNSIRCLHQVPIVLGSKLLSVHEILFPKNKAMEHWSGYEEISICPPARLWRLEQPAWLLPVVFSLPVKVGIVGIQGASWSHPAVISPIEHCIEHLRSVITHCIWSATISHTLLWLPHKGQQMSFLITEPQPCIIWLVSQYYGTQSARC